MLVRGVLGNPNPCFVPVLFGGGTRRGAEHLHRWLVQLVQKVLLDAAAVVLGVHVIFAFLQACTTRLLSTMLSPLVFSLRPIFVNLR